MNVTWKKDDALLETTDGFNTTKMGDTLYSQYRFAYKGTDRQPQPV